MLRFFRRIRQKLNNTGNLPNRQAGLKKYSIYAIGEILLVMIGILLAIQVNNWNEQLVRRILRLVNINEFKRHQTASVLRVSSKAISVK